MLRSCILSANDDLSRRRCLFCSAWLFPLGKTTVLCVQACWLVLSTRQLMSWKVMKREDETTLQCDPSDGIVETVTNVQALVVRVPAYTLWIIELCLILSTVHKAFSCTSQGCDLLCFIKCQHGFWYILIMFISIWNLFLSAFGHLLAIK